MITNELISTTHWVVQGAGNVVSDMGGEKVMLSVHNGKYYNLGTTGGVIWDYIKEPIKIEQLIEKLMVEYDVNQTQCEEHVLSFLGNLSKEGLITVTPAP